MRSIEELVDLLAGANSENSAALGRRCRSVPFNRAEYRRLERAGMITMHGTDRTIHLTKRGVAVRDRTRTDARQEARS